MPRDDTVHRRPLERPAVDVNREVTGERICEVDVESVAAATVDDDGSVSALEWEPYGLSSMTVSIRRIPGANVSVAISRMGSSRTSARRDKTVGPIRTRCPRSRRRP